MPGFRLNVSDYSEALSPCQTVAPPAPPPHYVPDRPVAVNHVRLSFEPDLACAHAARSVAPVLTARQDAWTRSS